jgi:hypothetical protein
MIIGLVIMRENAGVSSKYVESHIQHTELLSCLTTMD